MVSPLLVSLPPVGSRGRKPQPPSPQTARRLQALHKHHQQAGVEAREALDKLALAILDCYEQEGASVRQIGALLGVPHQTVDVWKRRAQQLRGS